MWSAACLVAPGAGPGMLPGPVRGGQLHEVLTVLADRWDTMPADLQTSIARICRDVLGRPMESAWRPPHPATVRGQEAPGVVDDEARREPRPASSMPDRQLPAERSRRAATNATSTRSRDALIRSDAGLLDPGCVGARGADSHCGHSSPHTRHRSAGTTTRAELPTDSGKNVVVDNYIYSLLRGMSGPDVSGKAITNPEVKYIETRRYEAGWAPWRAGGILAG